MSTPTEILEEKISISGENDSVKIFQSVTLATADCQVSPAPSKQWGSCSSEKDDACSPNMLESDTQKPTPTKGDSPRLTSNNHRRDITTSKKIRFPNSILGFIIGKGGTNFRRLVQQTGIYDLYINKLLNDGTCTTAYIRGKETAVHKAYELLQKYEYVQEK